MKTNTVTQTDLDAVNVNEGDEAVSHDSLDLHFRSMSSFRLLTRDDELSLARRLERADLAISRALLESVEGRAALRELARGVRESELRVEDVERDPREDLPARIEAVVARADKRPSRSRTRPRAHGLRLHPRAVIGVVRDLEELSARQPRNEKLKKTLGAVERARQESDRVTRELVQSNLRIVVTFARRYRGMPLVDLIQEGNLGLLRAIDKYDHRRGLRFSTYAAWWIRHALSRALADQSKMIRLPVHLTGAVLRVRRAQDRLLRETGRDATPEEIAARTGMALDQVKRALDVVAQPISLDIPISGAGDRDAGELGDLVVDTSTVSAEEAVASHELENDTKRLLSELPEREAEIIRMRFGIGGGSQRTLEEIGARLSLSRERARQLERDALRKLRIASESRRLRSHLDGRDGR